MYAKSGVPNDTACAFCNADSVRLSEGETGVRIQMKGQDLDGTTAVSYTHLCKRNHKELLTEDKMMSYIEDCGLDSYYLDFYEERMSRMLDWDADGSVEESLDFMLELMDIYEGVIRFLSDNRGLWEVEDGYITFENDDLAAQYDSLLYELYEEDTYSEEVSPEDEELSLIHI